MDKQQSTFPISREIATRARSMDFYGLSMALPNPDPVLKKIGKDESVYRGILVDAWIGGCLLSRTAGVRPRPWGDRSWQSQNLSYPRD